MFLKTTHWCIGWWINKNFGNGSGFGIIYSVNFSPKIFVYETKHMHIWQTHPYGPSLLRHVYARLRYPQKIHNTCNIHHVQQSVAELQVYPSPSIWNLAADRHYSCYLLHFKLLLLLLLLLYFKFGVWTPWEWHRCAKTCNGSEILYACACLMSYGYIN